MAIFQVSKRTIVFFLTIYCFALDSITLGRQFRILDPYVSHMKKSSVYQFDTNQVLSPLHCWFIEKGCWVIDGMGHTVIFESEGSPLIIIEPYAHLVIKNCSFVNYDPACIAYDSEKSTFSLESSVIIIKK